MLAEATPSALAVARRARPCAQLAGAALVGLAIDVYVALTEDLASAYDRAVDEAVTAERGGPKDGIRVSRTHAEGARLVAEIEAALRMTEG